MKTTAHVRMRSAGHSAHMLRRRHAPRSTCPPAASSAPGSLSIARRTSSCEHAFHPPLELRIRLMFRWTSKVMHTPLVHVTRAPMRLSAQTPRPAECRVGGTISTSCRSVAVDDRAAGRSAVVQSGVSKLLAGVSWSGWRPMALVSVSSPSPRSFGAHGPSGGSHAPAGRRANGRWPLADAALRFFFTMYLAARPKRGCAT